METIGQILLGILKISSICGFLCAIALLILLFLIPTISRTRGKLDKEGESPQAKQDDPDGAVHHRGSSDIISNTSSKPYYIQAAIHEIHAREERQAMSRAVTTLLILTVLHAILIPWLWVFVLTKDLKLLAAIILISYPVLKIKWYVLFLKTLFAKRFRETPCFVSAGIICMIDLIPIATCDIYLIPALLLSSFLDFIVMFH